MPDALTVPGDVYRRCLRGKPGQVERRGAEWIATTKGKQADARQQGMDQIPPDSVRLR